MWAWEEWSSSGNCVNNKSFPCLRELKLENCQKLKRGLPGRLDSLFELKIRDCPFLSASGRLLSLSSLGELHIQDCNDELLKCLVETTCTTKTFISYVPQLVCFDGWFSSSWDALEELHIEECPRFKSFEDEYGREQVPPKLKKLVIKDCADLERLPDDLSGLTYLNEMTVLQCQKLSSFPSMGLPPALRKVEIDDCSSLPPSQFLGMRLLEKLTPRDIEGLMSIEDVIIGAQSLRELDITNCRSLTTIPDSLQHLSSLSELTVWGCEALELDCFPALPFNLVKFELCSCPKVKSLPQDMHNLTSLKGLSIRACDGITCLPRGGLPPNLEWLTVGSCRMMNQPLEGWGMAGVTALQGFSIGGEMGCVDEMVCFPSSSAEDSDAWRRLLPESLIKLEIRNMKKVERLSGGLRAHLSSLQQFHISFCEKMRELPEEGLPDSLEWLNIEYCGLLKEIWKEAKGDYWPLLQRIPHVCGC